MPMSRLCPAAYSLIYLLRRKGVRVDTRRRTILLPYGRQPSEFVQAVRLCREFNICIQYTIT